MNQLLDDDSRVKLGRHLDDIVRRPPRRWVRKTNVAFNRLFDSIFSARKTAFEDATWMGLLLSPLMLTALLSPSFVQGEAFVESTTEALLIAVGGSFGFAFGLLLGRWSSDSTLRLIIGACIIGTVSGVGSISGIGNLSSIGAAITFGIVLGLGFIIGAFRTTDDSFGGDIVYSIGGGIVVGIVVGFVVGIGAGIVAGIVIGIGNSIVLGIDSLYSKGFHMPVRPEMALMWSLVFVAIAGAGAAFANPNVLVSFRAEWDTVGVTLFAFVAFNMFADSVSLVETRWVLRRGLKASWYSLVGLLALDLLLSTAIFMYLPLVLGELPDFWDAAFFFAGSRPWLGVLFWTTFSTSAVFYLFVLSSLLVRPLSRVPKLARHLQAEDQPVRLLTLTTVIMGSVLFWGIVGLTQVF